MPEDRYVANVVVVASSKILPILAIPTLELAEQSRMSPELNFVSGFQTSVERSFLATLLPRSFITIIPARDFLEGHRLYGGELWKQVKRGLANRNVQILAPPGMKGHRITRENAEIRNAYLLEIADVLLVLSAPPDSKTHALALKALGQGLSVFTFEHAQHQALFAAGAQVATIDAIVATIGSEK